MKLQLFSMTLLVFSYCSVAHSGYEDARKAIENEDYSTAFVEYKKLADEGDSRGENGLALLYLDALGIERDCQKAINLLESAAGKGLPNAQSNLGSVYLDAVCGVEKDSTKARLFFELAANQGFASAQVKLAKMYKDGDGGLKKDNRFAMNLYYKAAQQGDKIGEYYYGVGLAEGVLGEKKFSEGIAWLEKSANRGYTKAYYDLGKALYHKENKQRDEAKGFYYLEKSANSNDPKGMHSLGLAYFNGQGVAKNESLGVNWLLRAAQNGYAPAQFQIGLKTTLGVGGLEKSDSEALTWFLKAANQKNPAGMSWVGAFYLKGKGGLPVDHKKAAEILKECSEMNDNACQYSYAYMIENQLGGLKFDKPLIITLLEKSASQGNESAQRKILKFK